MGDDKCGKAVLLLTYAHIKFHATHAGNESAERTNIHKIQRDSERMKDI
jgi:hypothetical protein